MKEYRFCMVDWSKPIGKMSCETHCKGIAEVRAMSPVKLSWSSNVKAWCGIDIDKHIECYAQEIRRTNR